MVYRKWRAGDVVNYSLPMEILRVVTNERVVDNAGKIALERGPIVFCLEGIDNGPETMSLLIADSTRLQAEFVPGELSGIVTIKGSAVLKNGQKTHVTPIKAIPYFAWNNRGANEMKVWVPETK